MKRISRMRWVMAIAVEVVVTLLAGCATPTEGSARNAGAAKPWEDGAVQAVNALIRGDAKSLFQATHLEFIRIMRKKIIATIKANPTSDVSINTMREFGVSTAEEIESVDDVQLLAKAMRMRFLNNTDSPRVKLTGNGLRAIRSYYLDGMYQVIVEGEGKPHGITGSQTVTVYMRRENVDWRYYGDPSIFVITSMPKEFQARDAAITAAEKGNYEVVDAGNPREEKKGWRVFVRRRRVSSADIEEVSVFVSSDFKSVTVKTMMRVGDPDPARVPAKPFR